MTRGSMPWNRHPEGWFELWPHQPLLASSEQEAKEKFLPLLPDVEAGNRDEEFRKLPYHPPIQPTKIKEIAHPTREIKALFFSHPEEIIEARYFVHELLGRWSTKAGPGTGAEEWDWVRVWLRDEDRNPLRTLADDLASAEQIAGREMELLLLQHPDIRVRA